MALAAPLQASWLSAALAGGAAVVAAVLLRLKHIRREHELLGKRVVVIGAGVSGLAAAARLHRQGFNVTVIEARDGIGGLSATTSTGGFQFNDGALFVAGVGVMDELFSRLGVSRNEIPPMHEIRCAMRVVVPGGDVVTIGPGTDVRVLRRKVSALASDSIGPDEYAIDEAASAKASAELASLVARWLPVTRVLEGTLLRPLSLLAILRAGAWRHLPLLIGAGTLAEEVGRSFSDPAVQAALGSSLLYQGAPPQAQPAAMLVAVVMMCADEFSVPEGGMGAIPRALLRCCASAPDQQPGLAVTLRTGCSVPPGGIDVRGGRVVGVWCERSGGDREYIPADAVVVSASGMVAFGVGESPRGLVAAEHVPRAMRVHTARAMGHLSHSMLSVQLGLRVSWTNSLLTGYSQILSPATGTPAGAPRRPSRCDHPLPRAPARRPGHALHGSSVRG